MKNAQNKIVKENILVVGETWDQLSLLLTLLTDKGYQICCTINPQEVVELAQSKNPALIILSSALAANSYALCQQLKAVEFVGSIPVLFLISDSQPFDVVKVFQVGGSDYLDYPFRSEVVIARIEQQLTIPRLRQELEEKTQQLQQGEALFRQTCVVDSVTQIANRHRFDECLAHEWLRCARERVLWGDSSQTSLSLILCHLDRLELEDSTLKKLAQSLTQIVKRPSDLVARYREQEFAVLLPNTDEAGAMRVVELIQAEIRSLTPMTLSFGLVTGIPTRALPPFVLVEAAFQALQQAIQAGGDRLVSDRV